MDDRQVPKIAIVIEAGVVKRVVSSVDVEFVVLDLDLLVNEDVVHINQLAKVLPEYVPAATVGDPELDNARKRFKEEAKRRLRLLTE